MNRMFGLLSGMLAISENSARAECGKSAAAVKPFARHGVNLAGDEVAYMPTVRHRPALLPEQAFQAGTCCVFMGKDWLVKTDFYRPLRAIRNSQRSYIIGIGT